jgi:hypothetical protein
MLRALRVDVKVQQELLRRADIRTTLNIYTQAVPEALRKANSRVVQMVLPERKSVKETRGQSVGNKRSDVFLRVVLERLRLLVTPFDSDKG